MPALDLTVEQSWRRGGPAAYGSYAVEKRLETLFKYLSLRGRRVLDLGCGNGCYTKEMARRAQSVIGVDLELSNLTYFQVPIPRLLSIGENLPFRSSSFDIVTMIEVLEHTADDHAVLAECYRILRPGGYLALFVPNKLYPMESHPCHIAKHSIGRNIPFVSWLPDSLRKHFCFARIYSQRRLLRMTREKGFTVEKVGYIYPPIDTFPLPQKLKLSYRRVSWKLEESPLKIFGVSIFALLRKSSSCDAESAVRT
jgi:2-polyprenyl-3-methyl-5-hydroxy-6-metoxy-1,4-benzoquinol methylase